MGEFGRAPLVANGKELRRPRLAGAEALGRVLLGGAGRGGRHAGGSVRPVRPAAAYPLADPVRPATSSATLFHALGIPADTHYEDLTGRPSRVVTGTR